MPKMIALQNLLEDFGVLGRYIRKFHPNIEILRILVRAAPSDSSGNFHRKDRNAWNIAGKANFKHRFLVDGCQIRPYDHCTTQSQIPQITKEHSWVHIIDGCKSG